MVGVTSRGSLGCDDPTYGHVFGWGQWIKDTALHAATLGGYAPPGWAEGKSTDAGYNGPIGASCDPVVCTSGFCLESVDGEYCTHKCDDVNTCPEGYECDADLALCAKLPPAPPPPPPPTGDSGDVGDDGDEGSCTISGSGPTGRTPWGTAMAMVLLAGALAIARAGSKK